MKTLLLILLLIASFSFSVFAQTENPEPQTTLTEDSSPIATVSPEPISLPDFSKFEEHHKTISEYDKLARQQQQIRHKEQNHSIDEINDSLKTQLPTSEVDQLYRKAKTQWRELAEKVIHPAASTKATSLQELPKASDDWPEAALTQLKSLAASQDNIRNFRIESAKESRQAQKDLFHKSSHLRSKLIKRSLENNNQSLFSWSADYVKDLKTELLIVPLQLKSFVQSKVSEVKNNLYGGFYGLTRLIKELLIIIIVLLSPFFLFRVLKLLTNYLDQVRNKLVRKSYRQPEYGQFALWIRRLNPYVPWIVTYFFVDIVQWALRSTTVNEMFAVIAPYIKYYILYRIFKLLIELGLSHILKSNRTLQQLKTKKRMKETSQFIGRFFLAILFVLQTSKAAVGEGLIYLQVSAIAGWAGYIILSIASSAWKEEISHFLKGISSHPALTKVANLCTSRFTLLFCFPAVLFIFAYLVLKWIISWGQKFELIKKLSLKILRIRLESGQKKAEESKKIQIPDEYLIPFGQSFEPQNNLWVEPQEGFSRRVYKNISDWTSGASQDESILAIYGERGLGKTKLLNQLSKMAEKDKLKTFHIDISQKITSKKAINKYFSNLLGVDFENPNLEIKEQTEDEKNTKKEKTIVFVDNAQNLFLAQLGGFDGLEAFIQLVNSKAKDIYWCISFTEQSWIYLNYVLGKNHYFRKEIRLPRWNDDAIQKLIKTAHDKTDFKIIYDNVLFAATGGQHHGESVNIEDRFFDLLWEQSQGNPEVAKHLWLKAVTQVRAKNLKLSLPKSVDLSDTTDFNDEMYFLFASIFRHENLSIHEAVESTHLPFGLVRQAFYRGFEDGLLENLGQQRFRISVQWTHPLLKYLKRKNMLYGN